MNGLLTLLILAFAAYMLFSRRSGMGCCGVHHGHNTDEMRGRDSTVHREPSNHADGTIIDLKAEDYKILSTDGNQAEAGDR